jgi:hypothetical protein
MATPQPQVIVIQDSGRKSSPLETLKFALVLGGVSFAGYFYYETFVAKKDPCGSDGVFSQGGLLGNIVPFNPLCEVSGIFKYFKGLVDVGVGVPVELEACPAGWTSDGLTCREPISCGEGLDFFSQGCSGGNVVGRLDNGGTCPADHPDYIDGLCYKSCPAGYIHTEGMPYTCRKEGGDGDFITSLTKGFSPAITGLFD